MTYYASKPDKQWKRYTMNIMTCAKNDTCSLFYSYLIPHLPKNCEISFIRTHSHKILKKNESFKREVERETYLLCFYLY